MPKLTLDTYIRAPQRRCFDLARDVGVHCQTAVSTEERVLPPGVTEGRLELGDTVIFEARHLGVRQRLEARITRMDAPRSFTDEMVRGVFKSLIHVHLFLPTDGGRATTMRDELAWVSPLGPLGRIADALLVTRHLRNFLRTRALGLKAIAEASQPAGENLAAQGGATVRSKV
ncbi:MAG: SRPBCC family protein [Acidobacteriota bacterium]